MPYNRKLFGEKIKKKRREMHLSQISAAEKLGISPNHLSSLETGKSKPSYDVICNLCELLGTNPDYFFSGSLHSNNVSKDIIDKLQLLPESKQKLVSKIIDFLLEE